MMLFVNFIVLLLLKTSKIPEFYFKLNSKRNVPVSIFRACEKLATKHAKLQLDLLYFEHCLELGLCPDFLKCKPLRIRGITSITGSINEQAVKYKISEIQKQIKTNISRLHRSKQTIQEQISWLEWITLSTLINNRIRHELDKIKIRHEEKLTKLWIRQRIYTPEAVKNFSTVKLTTCELDALRYGLKHHILPSKLKIMNFKASMEKGFHFIKADISSELDHRLKDKVKHHCDSFINASASVCGNTKNKKLHNTLRNLSRNAKIKVTSYDKGNGIVILDSEDNISKLDSIISDQTKFEVINYNQDNFSSNPVIKAENKLVYFLRKYVKPFINDNTYRNIIPSGSQPGKLYGMSKVHKPNCPLRPVVSMIGTAEYNLAKFLDNYIKPNIPDHHMLNSTNQLLHVLQENKHRIKNNHYMVSFDVVSLFTNIPLKESIDLAADYVYNNSTNPIPPFDKNTFKRLLGFATSGIFTFNGNYYKQTDGVIMGSPLGPTLANLFLGHLEQNWLSQKFSPILYKRYVDDIFCIFENEIHSNMFLDFINQQHQNLQFTVEPHQNNTLPFLDLEISMNNQEFETKIYRKVTFTGLLLNFNAICPIQWKKGLITGLLHRAFTACSTWHSLHDEINNIKNLLQQNSYPLKFVDNLVRKFFNSKFENRPIKVSDEIERKYSIQIPYIGNPSLILKKKLQKLFRYSNTEINIIFSTFKVRNYFSLKDKTNTLLKSSLVYQYKCLDDPSLTYVGKTKRHFNTRISEHKKSGSAIHAHLQSCTSCGTNTDHFHSRFNIIDSSARSEFELRILEALYISTLKPKLNKQLTGEGTCFVLNIF